MCRIRYKITLSRELRSSEDYKAVMFMVVVGAAVGGFEALDLWSVFGMT